MAGNRLRYLTVDDWVLLEGKAVRRTFKLGEEIIRQSDWGCSIYIIRRGEAAVELAGTGSRAIVAVLGPEDICGDMAFLEQGKATAAVVAKDVEVDVDEIKAHDLREILEAFPQTFIALLPVAGAGPGEEAEGHYRRTSPGNDAARPPRVDTASRVSQNQIAG